MEGDDLDQDKVQPILPGRIASLTIKDVEHLLIYRKKNTQMPFLPKGGEVYIFQPEKEIESRDWVSDGHSFSCEGTRKVRGNTGDIKKYYYQLHIDTEGKKRITDKRFRKEVYVPLSPEYKNIAVLHYIGDASISKPKAHGNSKKQTKIFVIPKPSAIKLIEENVKANTEKSAHKALLFKHQAFEEKPVMPALFMIHERKFQTHHEIHFNTLRSYCKYNLTNVPIDMGMATGILNAVEAETTLKIVGCWRHLRKDVERHVFSLGGNQNDANFYVEDIYDILRIKNPTSLTTEIRKRKAKWSKEYVTYFESNIEIKLENFARCHIDKYVEVDPESGVTSNQSEGF